MATQQIGRTTADTAKFACNSETGVLFIVSPTMFFQGDSEHYLAPENLVFFIREDEAREYSDAILNKHRVGSRLPLTAVEAPAETAVPKVRITRKATEDTAPLI